MQRLLNQVPINIIIIIIISASHHILCHSHPIHTLSHQQQFTHNVSVCVYRLLSVLYTQAYICKFHTKTHTIHTEKFICTQQGVHGGTSTQLTFDPTVPTTQYNGLCHVTTFFHTKMGGLRCLWTSHPLERDNGPRFATVCAHGAGTNLTPHW